MDKVFILNNTTSYEDELIEDLKDPEEALAYLEAALEAYEEDKHTGALFLALRNVTKAHGGISKLSKNTGISRQHLYDVFASEHNPRLDNMLNILSALGFRFRLERHDVG